MTTYVDLTFINKFSSTSNKPQYSLRKEMGTWALTGANIFVHRPKLENQLSTFVALVAPTVMTVVIRAGE